MKTFKKILQLLTIALFIAANNIAKCQGTFQNLNFEQANPVPGSLPFLVAASNAIPSWVSYLGPEIAYNTVGIGGASISLHDSMSTHFQPLQGNYSILLQGGLPSQPPTSAAIGQTGQIPAGSLSLRFWVFPTSNLQVIFGGQLIPVFKLSSTANYDVMGGDITMFAGQTAELRFTAPVNSAGFFDNIFFSNQPIPEPSVFSLIGLGALMLCRRFQKQS